MTHQNSPCKSTSRPVKLSDTHSLANLRAKSQSCTKVVRRIIFLAYSRMLVRYTCFLIHHWDLCYFGLYIQLAVSPLEASRSTQEGRSCIPKPFFRGGGGGPPHRNHIFYIGFQKLNGTQENPMVQTNTQTDRYTLFYFVLQIYMYYKDVYMSLPSDLPNC